jgi:hypothetical protein
VTGRPVISPTAIMSAVDSVKVTSMTTHIEITAASGNWGGPKWNGWAIPSQAASPTDEKFVRPRNTAAIVPPTRPISTPS